MPPEAMSRVIVLASASRQCSSLTGCGLVRRHRSDKAINPFIMQAPADRSQAGFANFMRVVQVMFADWVEPCAEMRLCASLITLWL